MSWADDAACRGANPRQFFDPPGGSAPPAISRYCERCTVRFECVTEAVEAGEWDTIRGGMSATKRRKLRGVLVRIVRARDRDAFEHVTAMSRSEIELLRRRERAA